MKFKALLLFMTVFLCHRGHAMNYSMGTDYYFLLTGTPLYLDASFAQVGSADFRDKGFKNTHLDYSEGCAAAFVNFYLHENHQLSFQAGVCRMDLDWKQNPQFRKKHFDDLVLSLGYVTQALENWRWVLSAGVHADVDYFDFGKHAFYTGMIWGRNRYNDNLGFHLGVLGQKGVKSSYVYPIFGFDWQFHKQWRLHLIFPLDFSLHLYFSRNFNLALNYRGFGGWYRSAHRVGRNEPTPNAIFSLYSTGLDLGAYYTIKKFSAGIYGGYNLGGWIFIRNEHGHKPTYFHFNMAPYGGVKASLSF